MKGSAIQPRQWYINISQSTRNYKTDGFWQSLLGSHLHGMLFFNSPVPATAITITITTGYTSVATLNLPSLPSCIKYTFQVLTA
jgi:hypothetical protein